FVANLSAYLKLLQLAIEPRSGKTPIALDGGCGHVHHSGRFRVVQATEVAQLHDLTTARIKFIERFQCLIKSYQLARAFPRNDGFRIEINSLQPSAAFS